MEYTFFGRTGLRVSRLCLGTMNFGQNTTEVDAFRIMDEALEVGLNFFDTANIYGGGGPKGLTEEIMGRWFSQGGGRREKVVLAAKVYGSMGDPHDGPNDAPGLSAYKIRRHLEASLKRLKTDHVELYQMHHIDRHAPWEEIWETLQLLVQQGKIFYVGSSNFAGWQIVKAQAAAEKRLCLGLVSEQHQYSLLCRMPELEVLPACLNLGIGVIPYSPLKGGILGGTIDVQEHPRSRRSRGNGKTLSEKHEKQIKAFAELCRRIGQSESAVALAWILRHPAIAAPIIGPRTSEQLKEALPVVSLKLDSATLSELDKIFPGPGGEAPEAYAW